jgi:hypothetical protein
VKRVEYMMPAVQEKMITPAGLRVAAIRIIPVFVSAQQEMHMIKYYQSILYMLTFFIFLMDVVAEREISENKMLLCILNIPKV